MKNEIDVKARAFFQKSVIFSLLFPFSLALSYAMSRKALGMLNGYLAVIPVLSVILPLMLVLRWDVGVGNVLGARPFQPKALLRALPVVVSGCLLTAAYVAFCLSFHRQIGFVLFFDRDFGGQMTWLGLLTAVIMPVIAEELIGRGLWLSHFRALGMLLSVILCSFASAVLFLPSLEALPFFLIFSLLLSFLRLESGSVFPSLICALIVRGLGYVFLNELEALFSSFQASFWLPIGIGCLLVALAVGVFALDRKTLGYLDGQIRRIPRERKNTVVFVCVFILALVGAAFLYFRGLHGLLAHSF